MDKFIIASIIPTKYVRGLYLASKNTCMSGMTHDINQAKLFNKGEIYQTAEYGVGIINLNTNQYTFNTYDCSKWYDLPVDLGWVGEQYHG